MASVFSMFFLVRTRNPLLWRQKEKGGFSCKMDQIEDNLHLGINVKYQLRWNMVYMFLLPFLILLIIYYISRSLVINIYIYFLQNSGKCCFRVQEANRFKKNNSEKNLRAPFPKNHCTVLPHGLLSGLLLLSVGLGNLQRVAAQTEGYQIGLSAKGSDRR